MGIRIALLALLAGPALAQDSSPLPAALFGIELGSVYEYDSPDAPPGAVGTFPMKRLISARRSLHRGASLYFEPLTASAEFPFHEIAQDGGAPSTSTYRVFVFPVLPDDIRTLTETEARILPQRVFMIEWAGSDVPARNNDDYAWAFELCRSFETELRIAPEVTDRAGNGVYRCLFSGGERELEVSSAVGRTVQLSFADDVEDATESEVYSKIRRLELAGRGGRGSITVR